MTETIARRRSRKPVLVLVAVLALLATALAAWGFLWEPNQVEVRRVTIELPGWPKDHGPLRVALLSDVHAGAPFIDANKIESVVAAINREHPDLILLLGDYVIHGVVGGQVMAPEAIAPLLKDLSAPLGVYAVLGNHDWWTDGEAIRKAISDVGITFLDERTLRFERPEGDFWLLGIGDLWEGEPNIGKTLAAVGDAAPVVAFTHNPDIFPEVPQRVTVTFAGHTHGGQVDLPLLGRTVVPSRYGDRYAYGLIVEDAKHLFVTSGLGTSILPVRFRVPPEIALVTIRARETP